MATKRQTSHRDEAVTQLRALYKQIDNEIRELQREKDQVAKALSLFVKDDGSIATPRRSPHYGPRRFDSHNIVMQAVTVHRVPDKEFTLDDVREWTPDLRAGQANAATHKLVEEGQLIRVKKGVYKLPPKENNNHAKV